MLRLAVLILVCWGCSPSGKKIHHREEYPDFSEEQSTPADQSEITMCGSPKVTRAHYHIVEICQMKFVPPDLTVSRGDTVEWINKDITNHCVTEERSKAWNSPAIVSGKSWKKIILSSANYYCSIHLVMKGTITIGDPQAQ